MSEVNGSGRELFSGQGKIHLAKKNADGSLQPSFWIGNAPKLKCNFLTGEVEIMVDELSDDVLEIICGTVKTVKDVEIDWAYFEHVFKEKVSHFELGDGAPFEYELTFNGLNTAAKDDKRQGMRPWRLKLYRVTTTPAEDWEFINDDFAAIRFRGIAEKDELKGNKRGFVQRVHCESSTGMRTRDSQMNIALKEK